MLHKPAAKRYIYSSRVNLHPVPSLTFSAEGVARNNYMNLHLLHNYLIFYDKSLSRKIIFNDGNCMKANNCYVGRKFKSIMLRIKRTYIRFRKRTTDPNQCFHIHKQKIVL